MNSKEKLLRLKLLKLNLTRPLRNLRDYIRRDMSYIFSGRIQLKTVEREMNSLMKLVNSTDQLRTFWIRRRPILRITRRNLIEKKITTRN